MAGLAPAIHAAPLVVQSGADRKPRAYFGNGTGESERVWR